jgi:integrase
VASYTRKKNAASITWVAQVRLKGFKPTSKSFPSQAEAKTWAEAVEKELTTHREAGVSRKDLPNLKVPQLIVEFLEDPNTKALRYLPLLTQLLTTWSNELAAERVRTVNVMTLRDVRARLMRGRAPATVNRYLAGMRACWRWGLNAGLVPAGHTWPTKLMLKEPKGRTRFLTDVELARLLAAAEAASPVMHVAVLISIACGIRQSELLRLTWADVDMDRQRLTVQLSKNGETRTVHLPGSAVKALRAYKKKAAVLGQRILTNELGKPISKDWLGFRWLPVRTAAQLDNFRWHDLRHSCASILAQQGASLLEIGSVLGHKSPFVTQRYSHLVEGAPVTGHAKLDEKLRGK